MSTPRRPVGIVVSVLSLIPLFAAAQDLAVERIGPFDSSVLSIASSPDGTYGSLYATDDHGDSWQRIEAKSLPDDIARDHGIRVTPAGKAS